MPSYLITGVSRGIGFAFLKHLSADPSNTIVGLVRDKASTDKKVSGELGRRPNVHTIQADITDYDALENSVREAASIFNGSLDYIIANAGIVSKWSAYRGLGSLGKDPQPLQDDLMECFRINVTGNIHLINLYMPLLLKGGAKKVISLSSGLADDSVTTQFSIDGAGPYSISKAAMNTAIAKFSAEYAQDGVLFMSISPGAVETGHDDGLDEEGMKGAMALGEKFARYAPHFKGRTTPDESVKDMMKVIDEATLNKGYGGKFLSQYGNQQWL